MFQSLMVDVCVKYRTIVYLYIVISFHFHLKYIIIVFLQSKHSFMILLKIIVLHTVVCAKGFRTELHKMCHFGCGLQYFELKAIEILQAHKKLLPQP